MTIPKELEGAIIRYAVVEKWPVGTIAREVGVHYSTVERVLHQAKIPVVHKLQRPSKVEPYLPFIHQTLEKFPALHASRLYTMVKGRGYPGAQDHFRHIISCLRPPKPAEAYLRLRTLPGEQGQVDWANFGKIAIGKAIRVLVAFVMVLSFSRKIFLRFFLHGRMSNFLQGHVEAFSAFGGCPRTLLYDNLKSAVLERRADAIRFHPTLLDFSSHYHYEPRPVAPYRGNEKGRVERAIQYSRHSFFAGLTFTDLADLNAKAKQWTESTASDRPWPEDRTLTVRSAFEQEQPRLLSLPENPYPTEERLTLRSGKTPYLRYDLNDYSIPYTLVRKPLQLVASEDTVRILNNAELVATHQRSYDRGAQVEEPSHVEELIEHKREARKHRGMDYLYRCVPKSQELLVENAERGWNLGSATVALLRMLDHYGAKALEQAIEEALQNKAVHPNSVRHILEREARKAGVMPAVPVDLPDDPRLRNLTVKVHDLGQYDALKEQSHDNQ